MQSSADLMTLIISVATYGIVPKSLGISCDIYKDLSGRLVLPFMEEDGMGIFFFFPHPIRLNMF